MLSHILKLYAGFVNGAGHAGFRLVPGRAGAGGSSAGSRSGLRQISGFQAIAGRRLTPFGPCGTLRFAFLAGISRLWRTFFVFFTRARRETSGVLHSQSALARSNSRPRASCSLVRCETRGVDDWVLLNGMPPNPVRSGRKQPQVVFPVCCRTAWSEPAISWPFWVSVRRRVRGWILF